MASDRVVFSQKYVPDTVKHMPGPPPGVDGHPTLFLFLFQNVAQTFDEAGDDEIVVSSDNSSPTGRRETFGNRPTIDATIVSRDDRFAFGFSRNRRNTRDSTGLPGDATYLATYGFTAAFTLLYGSHNALSF